MEALKQAFLKKMQQMKDGGDPKAMLEGMDQNPELEDDKKGSDLAPSIGDDDEQNEDEGQELIVEDKEHEAGEEDLLKQILAAIADKSGNGRPAMGLGERAAMGAKSKLDGMNK